MSGVGFGKAFGVPLETLAYETLFTDSVRQLQGWYQQVWPNAEDLAEHLKATLEAELMSDIRMAGVLEAVSVSARVKSVPSTFRKLVRARYKSIGSVRDII